MSKTFIHGMLAEKAKLANTLIAELMAELPDALLDKYHPGLKAGSAACRNAYADLRMVEAGTEDASMKGG